MDTGLLLTVLIVFGGVQLALRVLPPTAADRVEVVELLSTPLIAGLIAARLVFVLLDHPASVFQLRDLMVVRAGMEFWAGVLVALLLVLFRIRRSKDRGGAATTLAVATPFLLLGVALYEGSCLVRDGCLGPVASVGLGPSGLATTMVPVGVIVAVVLIVAALGLRHAWTLTAAQTVLTALVGVSGVRLVASWFLPAFGPSRVERESAFTLVASLAALLVLVAQHRRSHRVASLSDPNARSEVAVDRSRHGTLP